jgi:hypothetical protein
LRVARLAARATGRLARDDRLDAFAPLTVSMIRRVTTYGSMFALGRRSSM